VLTESAIFRDMIADCEEPPLWPTVRVVVAEEKLESAKVEGAFVDATQAHTTTQGWERAKGFRRGRSGDR
jgi:hypothetical protein